MRKIILLCLFILTSCMEDDLSPEGALKSFIESRIGNVVTREYILERVTGKMKVSLEGMEPEEFEKFSDLRNIERNSFKILSKSCQSEKCYITYSIAYKTKKDNKAIFSSEVKKIAEIVSVNKKWLIADISNIKTYHEALEPINPLQD